MKKIGLHTHYYIYLVIFMLVSAIIIFNTFSVFAQCIKDENAINGKLSITLYAGQYIDTGLVSAEIIDTDNDNNKDALVISYSTTEGWELTEAHVWVGNELTLMPQTRKGNPKIGNFPYNSGDITGSTYCEFQVPLNSLGYQCEVNDKIYYIAAHAALRMSDGNGGYLTETGWADGDLFVQQGGWGTYLTITITCENCSGVGSNCETAFAYDDTNAACFIDIDEDGDAQGDFNRWGWSIGPLSLGVQTSYTFDIYTGAGQCDISKGTLVGTLTVEINGQMVTATYNMNSGSVLNEVHLYIGEEILPRDVNGDFTVAPGQYPLIDDELGGITEYMFTNLEFPSTVSAIYVVAHGVVCPTL